MSALSPELLPAPLTAAASAPALRLLPVPVSEPAYDDELPAPTARRTTRPLGPLRSLSPLHLVPAPPLLLAGPTTRTAVDHHDDELDRRMPLDQLPAARPVAHALVQGLLEVLAGVRPLSQLRRATSLELYDRLELAVHTGPRATGPRPTGAAVRSLHVQARADGVAEVCATVHRDGRTTALALRMEGVRGRWCCTELAGV
jgi:hypothetical protein